MQLSSSDHETIPPSCDEMPVVILCATCRQHGHFLCSGCRSISYCGKACQRIDRPKHKHVCRLLGANMSVQTINTNKDVPGDLETTLRLIKCVVPDDKMVTAKELFVCNEKILEVTIHPYSPFTVSENSKWADTQRMVSLVMNSEKPQECEICMEDLGRAVTCSKCRKYTCTSCYIERFRVGSGIIQCPFCRDEIGHYHNKRELEAGIRAIKQRLAKR
jgi:hypothetical protein